MPLVEASIYGTIWLLLVAYLARFLALGLRPTMAGMELVDRALDEAGQVAGAGVVRRLRSIMLPLVAASAAAGALLIFMTAFNELTVSALLWWFGVPIKRFIETNLGWLTVAFFVLLFAGFLVLKLL